MLILARIFSPARNADREKYWVNYIVDILDIILRLSGVLLCFRASGGYFAAHLLYIGHGKNIYGIILHIVQYGIILYNMVPYCTIW